MASTSQPPHSLRLMLRTAGIVALLAVILLAAGLLRAHGVSREAVVYEAICHSVLANTTTGRQALVSSAWWPPIPALARMPLAATMPAEEGWPIPSLVLSALAGAAAVFLLQRMLGRWGLGWPRLLVAGALLANPYFLDACCNGSNGTLTLFLALLCSYGLAQWMHNRRLGALVYFAFAAALLVASSLGMALWLGAAALLLLLDLAAWRTDRARKEAAFLLGLLPALAMAALWVLMNWLIMGDPLYFLRGLFPANRAHALPPPFDVPVTPLQQVCAVAAFAVLAVGLLRRDRAGVAIGLLALAPPGVAALLRRAGLLWNPVPVLFCVFPLALAALGYGVRFFPRRRPLAAALAALFAVTATLWSFPDFTARAGAADGQTQAFGAALAERNEWLPQIESHVLAQSPYARVFVCGYDSFLLLGAGSPTPFIHALDFNFRSAEDDYAGCALFLLVHRPEGRSGMDSVHWRYDRIYELGSRNTLYNSDWGNWRLFEIVEAPR